jgi:hypothetical protein
VSAVRHDGFGVFTILLLTDLAACTLATVGWQWSIRRRWIYSSAVTAQTTRPVVLSYAAVA